MKFSRKDLDTYRQLIVLVAYQVANITMILGFFIALFLLLRKFWIS